MATITRLIGSFLKRKHIQSNVLFVCSLILLFSGCTTTGALKESYSGFLHDYSKLEPDPEYKGQLTWIVPTEELRKYTKFMIDPVLFYLSPELQDQPELDPKLVNDITRYMENALKEALEPDYPVVETPEYDVARLRFAITGVTVSRKDLKAYQYIPIALVVTGAGEVAGVRDRMAAVFMEGEALDSVTGKRLAAVVQRSGDEVEAKEVSELTAEQIYPILDFYAKKLRGRVDKIHGKR